MCKWYMAGRGRRMFQWPCQINGNEPCATTKIKADREMFVSIESFRLRFLSTTILLAVTNNVVVVVVVDKQKT